MGLLVCVLAGALVVGWATGGSLARLAEVPLHGWPLVLTALVAVGVGAAAGTSSGLLGDVAASGGLIVAATAMLALMVRNRRVEGVPLIALGLLLNAVVIGANGAMPVSAYAEARAGVEDSVADGVHANHELADERTRLRPLGDVVPVPLPVRPETVSPGDLLVVAGAGLLVLAGMHRRDRERDVS